MEAQQLTNYTKEMWEKMVTIKNSYESILKDVNSFNHLEPSQEMMIREFMKQKLQETKEILKDCQDLYFESVKIQDDESEEDQES